jgi:hypothetical protein
MYLWLPVPYYNQTLFGWERISYAEKGILMAGNVLSSDKETIPARYSYVIKAQAQVFMESGESLLPVLKAFAQCSRWLHTRKTFWCFQSACSSRTVCRSFQYGCRSSSHRARHASTLAGIILWCVNCRQKKFFLCLRNVPQVHEDTKFTHSEPQC